MYDDGGRVTKLKGNTALLQGSLYSVSQYLGVDQIAGVFMPFSPFYVVSSRQENENTFNKPLVDHHQFLEGNV